MLRFEFISYGVLFLLLLGGSKIRWRVIQAGFLIAMAALMHSSTTWFHAGEWGLIRDRLDYLAPLHH